jgi:hypothetical protein
MEARMTAVAILGAGGRIGYRITDKLKRAGYEVWPVEISDAGAERVRALGVEVHSQAEALAAADAVVLAVPDSLIGRVAQSIEEGLRSGTVVIILDAAAPFAGVLPATRADVSYFVCHPCHPPLFSDLECSEERRDYFGGVAPQGVVCALFSGTEEHYRLGEVLARTMFGPVSRTHRVTVEQLALLEPGLTEIVTLTMVDAICRALEDCVRRGVPREAATDFLLGHLNVEFAMWLGKAPKAPSDAALQLIEWARGRIFRDDWLDVLEEGEIRRAVQLIASEPQPQQGAR